MLISEPYATEIDGLAATAAEVCWEDRDAPPQTLHFATERAADLVPAPFNDSFFIGALVPAMQHGERRIAARGVDPYLVQGARAVAAQYAHWFDLPVPEFEVTQPLVVERPHTSAQFYTGGVDSSATLWTNRDLFPADHPGRIKHAIIVDWMHGASGWQAERSRRFPKAVTRLRAALEPLDVELLAVRSNFRSLTDYAARVWVARAHGPSQAASAHALNVASSIYFASSHELPGFPPYSSHPQVDAYTSATDLQIRHDNLNLGRPDKVRFVARHQHALDNLLVCPALTDDGGNCGRCEKCLRTSCALLVAGALDRSRAFAYDDVDPEWIMDFRAVNDDVRAWWKMLARDLARIGRKDLSRAIDAELRTLRVRAALETRPTLQRAVRGAAQRVRR